MFVGSPLYLCDTVVLQFLAANNDRVRSEAATGAATRAGIEAGASVDRSDEMALLGQLTKLSWIEYTDSGVTRLPSELGRLTLLNYLSVQGGRYSTIPTEFAALTALKRVNFARGALTSMPVNFVRAWAKSLRHLDLSANRIRDWPAKWQVVREAPATVDSTVGWQPGWLGRSDYSQGRGQGQGRVNGTVSPAAAALKMYVDFASGAGGKGSGKGEGEGEAAAGLPLLVILAGNDLPVDKSGANGSQVMIPRSNGTGSAGEGGRGKLMMVTGFGGSNGESAIMSTAGECAAGCPSTPWGVADGMVSPASVGDGACHYQCNTSSCGWEQGDCLLHTVSSLL